MKRLTLLTSALAAVACGGSDSNTGPDTTVTSISITPSAVALSGVGVSGTLAASVSGRSGPIANPTVTWTSSNSLVAEVVGAGPTATVTSRAPGSATIGASAGGQSATVEITVQARVLSVTVPSNTASVRIGDTLTLRPSVTADPGVPTTVTFRSTDPTKVSVSAAGLITGIAPTGTTPVQVIATSSFDASKSATVNVTVQAQAVPVVNSVRVAPPSVSIASGGRTTLTAVVSADPGVAQTVTWRSSGSSIATVSSIGELTAVSPGTTYIVALSTVDSTKRDSTRVTVTAVSQWITGRVFPYAGSPIGSILGLSGTGASNVFAATTDGDILRYDGSRWNVSLAGNGSVWNDVFATPTGSQVFAVSAGGDIAQLNGSVWSKIVPVTASLNGVWASSATNAYAVGDNGTILQLRAAGNVTSWTPVASGTSNNLNGVWGLNQNLVFAVGNNGTILRFDATKDTTKRDSTKWTSMVSNTTQALYRVWGTSATNVYAVGNNGTILHFDGTSWSGVTSGTTSPLYDIGGTSASSAFAVGANNTVLRFDGSTWSPLAAPYGLSLRSVWADTSGTVIGGDRGLSMVYRTTGTTPGFTTLSLTPNYFGVWALTPSTAFTVGEFGTILRFDGTNWNRQTSALSGTLTSVYGTSSSLVFSAGTNGIQRYDGSTWSVTPIPSGSGTVQALWGSSGTNVFYAVGDGGLILRWDGTSWTRMTAPTANNLRGVWGTAANQVYAVGFNGTILRYDGTAWTAMTSGTTQNLFAIWGSAANDILAVGANGTILRYDGTAWSPQASNSTATLTSVWGASATDRYAVGVAGTIRRNDGSVTWSVMPAGTARNLNAVSGTGTGGAFAVGDTATIVRGITGAATGFVAPAALRSGSSSPAPRQSGRPLAPSTPIARPRKQ